MPVSRPHGQESADMDPSTAVCPNLDCPARGQRGRGNIGVHSQKEHRYICATCRRTFVATKGTML